MPTSLDPTSDLARTTKVIAVADVVESVRLMEQDEQEFIRRWQRFVAFVQQLLPGESGRLRKSLGDGLMLEFSDAEGCIRAAVAMRAWFADANQDLAPEDQVQMRIGAHMAEFVSDEYDIYGNDVNLAARIASLAGPGEIVISAALSEHLGPALRDQLEDLGTCHVKHVREPVHVFRLGLAGHAPVLTVRRLATHALRPTMAVLPFGLQGGPAGELTGEALADDIVAALSRSEQLQVVSRMSTAPFGGASASLEELRRVVGAHYVLTGRARRQGQQVAVFIELADAASGYVVWARSFSGGLREAALSEGPLMREIVAAVHSAVIAREVERARGQPLPALEGHTLLLAAIGLMHWLPAADMEPARVTLEHLVERGRGHPAPHAWLAHLHALQLRQGTDGAAADEARLAREHGAAGVRCDAGSPLALAMLGEACLFAARDREAAEEHYAQALAARADDSLALVLRAELRALQGHGEAAVADARRADATFPLEPMRCLYDSIHALACVVAGHLEDAITFAQRAAERNPQFLPALRILAVAQVRGGRPAQAQRTVQRWATRDPQLGVAQSLATWPACPEVAQLLADSLRQAGVPAGPEPTSAPGASSSG